MSNIKDLKREIRQLRKIKRDLRAGTPERLEIGRKIKALKKQLEDLKILEKGSIVEKDELADNKKYKKVYYTGYLSLETRERMKKDFEIEYVKKE
jgi:hypothetical protein